MEPKAPFRKPTDPEFAEAARLAQLDRYARKPSQGGRVAALEKLHGELADYARLYDSGELQDQRGAVSAALLATIHFLRAQGFSHFTLGPLMRPVAALVERENNSLDQMFTERARGGRPKSTLVDHHRTGILAALAELWLKIHESDSGSQSEKLADAARKMRGRWFGQITGSQLKSARDLVMQEASDHPARRHSEITYAGCVQAAEMFGAENAFAVMVRSLNDMQASFGLGEGGISKTPPVSPTA